MTTDQLKTLFEKEYNRTEWTSALLDIFHIQDLHIVPHSVELGENNFNASALELGFFETAEGLLVGIYEVEIKSDLRLDRNKVGLRNLMRKVYTNDADAALMVFSQGDTWRFTYASELTVENKETGKREPRQNDPKRYTYIFGQNRSCRTAAERFASLRTSTDLFETRISIKEIEKAFSVDTLTKDFYRDLSNWYFWALTKVKFPSNTDTADELNNATSLIRLITRLIFVWFMKHKGLIPNELFDKEAIDKLLNYNDVTGSTYYKAILQNLFFATLNTPLKDDNRTFVRRQTGNQDYYRYQRFFRNKDRFLELTRDIPFLNGGLFDNLDKRIAKGDSVDVFIDCFTNHQNNESLLTIPDYLFFGGAKDVDLSESYDDVRQKHLNVKGIIDILHSYNFTVEENTPLDIQVALDPEMLGKVFENLLASYNPETKTSARKQTGSFYTPREIVSYMVDESLIAYLKQKLVVTNESINEDIDIEEKLHQLVSYSGNGNPFNESETTTLVESIGTIKVLDPACGSGAFPMGVLQQLVHILGKLDPENQLWRDFQIQRAEADISEALRERDKETRRLRLQEIEDAFSMNEDDYGRKLFLIENCIYGIDIQPIAVQISKLRFFISLICEQDKQADKENFGIKSLPNLETKFVAANTLIGIDSDPQIEIRTPEILKLEKELIHIRKNHFVERDKIRKTQLRESDKETRENILIRLREEYENNTKGLLAKIALEKVRRESLEKGLKNEIIPKHRENHKINIQKIDIEIFRLTSKVAQNQYHEQNLALRAAWDPYNTNASSGFFDMDWMFGIEHGFNVVIGNPPYGIVFDTNIKLAYEKRFQTFTRNNDIYVAFFENSLSLIEDSGVLIFISPNTYMNGDYFKALRTCFREKTYIQEIIDFKNSKIFQDPTVFVAITILQKKNKPPFPYNSKIKISNEDFTETNQINILISEINDKPLKPLNNIIERIVFKKHNFYTIDEKFLVKDVGFNYWTIGKGKKRDGNSIGDRILYSGIQKNIKDKSFLKGKDIEKFHFLEPSNYLIHNFEEYLEDGVDVFRYSANFLDITPKIIYRQTSNKIIAALDFNKNLCDKTIHVIVPRDPNESVIFLLALLNSLLFDYFYKDISQELEGRTFAQVKTIYIKQLPIIKTPLSKQQPFITLVNLILQAKKEDSKADISAWERRINEMVYKLYNLSYNEIKVIYPEFWLSEEEYEKVKLN